jgi:beta-glucosidase
LKKTSTATADDWYKNNVVYPFGYGLSYTNFEWQVDFKTASGSKITENDTIEVEVTVTNTGDYAGKDVVELYYTAPYTAGEIEKAEVVLGAFAKTPTLYPASQANTTDKPNSCTLTLKLDVADMKSYDYADANGNNFKGYELDAGNYKIIVGEDAHDSKAFATYKLEEDVKMRNDTDADGNTVEVVNRFDDVSAGIFGTNTYSSYTTRANFDGTIRSSYLSDKERTLTAEMETKLNSSIKRKYTESDEGKAWQSTTTYSTTPVNKGISLADMLYDEDGKYVGKVDFNDSRWEDLLDEISLDEMKTLVGTGSFKTLAVSGVDGVVDKPLTSDADGPCGFTNFASTSTIYGTCSYMAECVMGSTWNTELAYQMGQMVGEEGLIGNEDGDGMPYSGWYAPAINIHRSQFAGRNWEYYSEDCLLTGKLAAQVVSGAMSKGVYTYVKHFAVNDQETDREYNGILVWANEQSMREIYLKAFEITVKEGGTTAMMSSFNRLGTTWAGGSYALLTEVLRNEWGFHGMVITDWSTNNYTHVDEMIRAGGDLFLTQDTKTYNKEDDATQIAMLRRATKNILYTVANSNVMSLNVNGYSLPSWQIAMIIIDCAIVVACGGWGAWAIISAKKKDKKV